MKLGIISEPIHLLNSLFAVMIMMVYYYLPFMVLPIYSALERFNVSLIEASYDLGGTFFSTLRRILIPLTSRGIKAGFFLVYIPSFGEFVIPELMGGDKTMFVGTVVSQYILGEGTGSLGAAFTLLSGVVRIVSALILFRILGWILKPKARHG
jgi:spermidine/putrescine transport system permease protein